MIEDLINILVCMSYSYTSEKVIICINEAQNSSQFIIWPRKKGCHTQIFSPRWKAPPVGGNIVLHRFGANHAGEVGGPSHPSIKSLASAAGSSSLASLAGAAGSWHKNTLQHPQHSLLTIMMFSPRTDRMRIRTLATISKRKIIA